MELYWLFLFVPISYLIGNINISILIAKWKKQDIYKLASGNPGATNVLRNFGFKWGAIVLIFDLLKGVVPAAIAFFAFGGNIDYRVFTSQIALFACGLAVILGHCFPVFLKFKGGKGVATTIGVFTVAHPIISLIAFAIIILYILIFEYGAMASFIYITIMVVYAGLQTFNNANLVVCLLLFCIYFLIWYTHRTNIFRLLTGKENYSSILKKLQIRRRKKQQDKWLQALKEGEPV